MVIIVLFNMKMGNFQLSRFSYKNLYRTSLWPLNKFFNQKFYFRNKFGLEFKLNEKDCFNITGTNEVSTIKSLELLQKKKRIKKRLVLFFVIRCTLSFSVLPIFLACMCVIRFDIAILGKHWGRGCKSSKFESNHT